MAKRKIQFVIFVGAFFFISHLAYGQKQGFSTLIKKEFYDGKFQSVIHFYKISKNADSLSAHTYYLIGRSYQKLLRLQKALRVFQKAYKLNQSSVTVLSAIGMANEQLGNLDEAENAFLKILQVDSTNIPVRLALGKLYMKRRKWEPAAKTFRKLVSTHSTPGLQAHLGYCYLKLSNVSKALLHLKKSHKLNPRNSRVSLQLSDIYSKKKQWSDALQVINQTLTFHPKRGRLWQQRADINYNRDSIQAAAADYHKVLSLGDTTAATLRKLGACQVMLGKYKTAIKNLTTAYHQNAKNVVTNFYLGIAYRKTDSLDLSLKFLKQATDISITGLLTNSLKQLAQTYDAKRNLPKALGAYKLALNLNPDLSEVYFRLCGTLWQILQRQVGSFTLFSKISR